MASDKVEGQVRQEGYVTSEGGNVKLVTPPMMRVQVVTGFISHDRKALAPGERVTLPRALALAQCHIGAARELTGEELAAEDKAAPTPPGVVEHREPEVQMRDPRTRKR